MPVRANDTGSLCAANLAKPFEGIPHDIRQAPVAKRRRLACRCGELGHAAPDGAADVLGGGLGIRLVVDVCAPHGQGRR